MSSVDDSEGTSPAKYMPTGVDGLRRCYYVYGVPRQAENYLRTTRKIADHVGSAMSKEMRRLVHELEETKFPDENRQRRSRQHELRLRSSGCYSR